MKNQSISGNRSPDPSELDRAGSPKMNYLQRTGISSSIPVPKSVAVATQKKTPLLGSDSQKKFVRRGTIF